MNARLRRPALRGVPSLLLMLAGTFVTQALALGTGIIAARLLGVEGRGQIALVAAVASLAARLTLGGTIPTVTHLLARDGLRARDALRPFVRRWAVIGVVPSVAASAYLLFILRDEPLSIKVGLASGAAAVTFLVMLNGLVAAAVQGELVSIRVVVTGAILLQAPFFLALVIAFVSGWEGSAVGVIAIQVVASIVALFACSRFLKAPTGAASTIEPRELRSVGRANYFNGVGTIDGIGLDRNLIGALMGTTQLGLYSAATAVARLSTIVGNSVSAVLLPRLAAADGQAAHRRQLLIRWLPATAGMILVLVCGLQLVIAPVIELAFGDEFNAAIPCARWLLVADGLLGFRRVLISVLQATGRGGVASRIEIALTVVLAIGIVLAALNDSLVQVGISICVVAMSSCLCLLAAIKFGR